MHCVTLCSLCPNFDFIRSGVPFFMTACYAVYVQMCDLFNRTPSGESVLRHVYRGRRPITCQETMRLFANVLTCSEMT
jgi:hypothetical protein